ncbi:hypothetical protein FRX31_015836, partial [Thalictrum thalictroides]
AAIGTLDGIIDTFFPIPSLAIACSIEVSGKDSYDVYGRTIVLSNVENVECGTLQEIFLNDRS